MAEIERLILRLDAEVDKYEANMKRAAKTTSASSKRMNKSIDSTENQIKKFTTNGVRGLQIFAAAVGVALSTRELIRYADTWNRVQNRLLLATDSGAQAAEVLDRLKAVAIDSRTDFEATALLYQRLERGTRELGLETLELEAIVSTINKSFVLSGATAQEASASIIQLSQAFARGVLRGDEFRSVSEQAPVILEAISAATGQTRGELIKWAEQGALTTDVLVKSLRAYGEVVDTEFDKTKKTIGQAISVVETEFTDFIGKLDKTNSLTSEFSEFVTAAAKDLDDFVPSINTGIDRLVIWIKQWKMAFGSDAEEGIKGFMDTYEREMIALNSVTKITGQFLSDTFSNMPVNIVSAIKIAVIELMSFMDLAGNVIDLRIQKISAPFDRVMAQVNGKIKGAINDLNVLFRNITPEEGQDIGIAIAEDFDAEISRIEGVLAEASVTALDTLNATNTVRDESIAKIILERDEQLIATEQLIEGQQRIRDQADEDATAEVKRQGKKKKAFITLETDNTKELKKAEAIRKRLRSQGHKDAITILNALAGDSATAAKAVFLIDKALAANEVFVNTKVASMRALAELGPVIGAPVAASIEAAGALSIAAILASTLAGFPSGGGGGGVSSVGGSGGSPSPEINTVDLPDTASTEVSSGTQGGSNLTTIQFTAGAGDDLGEVMTDWINENIRKGRIG